MYSPECGQDIPDNAKFCVGCGAKLAEYGPSIENSG